MILNMYQDSITKLLLIDLKNSSFREVNIKSNNKLLSPATSLLAVLANQIENNNFIILSKGILGGKNGIGLSDAFICAVSPQSGGMIEAKIQGKLAKALFTLSLDAIVIYNCATSLTGLEIEYNNSPNVIFLGAAKLKGASVWETSQKSRSDNRITTLAIGKPGESQALAASIVCDNGFATAQGGLGAVFGRMNLKYLSLFGRLKSHSNETIKQITTNYRNAISKNPLTKAEFEAPGFGLWANSSLAGYMAGNNFGEKLPAVVEAFDPNNFIGYLKDTGSESCPGCPQQCLKSYLVGSGPIDGGRTHQMSITSLLSQFGELSTERLIEFNSYCHELGVEHLYISALFSQENLNSESPIKNMVDKVSLKKLESGFNQIKGMAMPPWEPRGNQGLFLAMALNPSGPRYDVIEHDIDFDPDWAWSRHVEFGKEFGIPDGGLPLGTLDASREESIFNLWLLWSALDSIGICIYAAPPTRELRTFDILDMVNSEISNKINLNSLYEIGLMRLMIHRYVNWTLNLSSNSDNIPEKFFEIPLSLSGAVLDRAVINRSDYQKMKQAIVKRLGWLIEGGVDENSDLWNKCKSEINFYAAQVGQL